MWPQRLDRKLQVEGVSGRGPVAQTDVKLRRLRQNKRKESTLSSELLIKINDVITFRL